MKKTKRKAQVLDDIDQFGYKFNQGPLPTDQGD
jgi:hypothetical protein